MPRYRISLNGTVQGVGMRPYIYRLAQQYQLSGWVQNDAQGVTLEIQGDDNHTAAFLQHLAKQAPPLAQIEQMSSKPCAMQTNETGFTIQHSASTVAQTHLAADSAICDSCLTELFDPNNHYYHYPFISCTDCGPRYTISNKLPYDRCQTSLAPFSLCKTCQLSYHDPNNRRFHAQAIACHTCGPQLSHSIHTIATNIAQGGVVAIQSLGGYQLVCAANNAAAVERLRTIKQRPAKPLAMMVLNVATTQRYVHCSPQAAKVLASRQRPIVVLPQRSKQLATTIAPGLASLGIMLPCTGLHYLLLHALAHPATTDVAAWLQTANNTALIVTSANRSNAPIMIDAATVRQEFGQAVDLIVSYPRTIVTAVDDSVVGMQTNAPFFMRRARGYTPEVIPLAKDMPTVLGLGAQLKSTICLIRGKEAFVSQPIGDLHHPDTRQRYHATVQHLIKLLNVTPAAIAHDLHPDFFTSQYAAQFKQKKIAMQHHHAHLGAVAAEYQLQQAALGLALDGFGLGTNKQAWGGELFFYHKTHYQRLAHLQPLLQPGGDRAVAEPWRMAASVLHALGQNHLISQRFAKQPQASLVAQLLQQGNQCISTSSCGRLFDAASALLGLCTYSQYDAQAAMLLENQVTTLPKVKNAWHIDQQQLSLLPLFNDLLHCDATTGANLFHGALCAGLLAWVKQYAFEYNIQHVLLSGGCFLNRIMSEYLITELTRCGLQPYYPRRVPVHDGGISLGQAWLAAQQLMEQAHVSGDTDASCRNPC